MDIVQNPDQADKGQAITDQAEDLGGIGNRSDLGGGGAQSGL
jgi:hypothetical protein